MSKMPKEKELQPGPGFSKKMSILYVSQKNQTYPAVMVGNELVGKAMVDLTTVELEDKFRAPRILTVENWYMN